MKVAAVVILYHPLEAAITNIKTYYNYFDTIYVFDNTEKETSLHDRFQKLSKIKYYHDSQNEGISKRLNTACNIAIENGFSWLLTMDQDTSFNQVSLSNYLNCFHLYKDKNKVAVFGPKHNRELDLNTGECKSEEVVGLITSGMLLNLEVFRKIGCFDEALFIDCVDHDYCIRARLAEHSIIQFSNVSTSHELGKVVHRSSIKSLFLIKKEKVIHSPLRCYYMYRNLLYLENKYKDFDKQLYKDLRLQVTSRIKASAFYGRNILTFIKYLRAAKNDFKNNKMGKIKQEL